MAGNLIGSVRVEMLVRSEEEREEASQFFSDVPSLGSVIFHVIPFDDIWVRDTGPIFVRNERGEKSIVVFDWNHWGYAGKVENIVGKDDALVSQRGTLFFTQLS